MTTHFPEKTVSSDPAQTDDPRAADRPPRRRQRRRPWTRRRFAGAALANGAPLVLLALWAYEAPHQPAYILPEPLDVARGVRELLVGDLADQTLTSLMRILIGVGLAVAIGGGLVLLGQVFPVLDPLVSHRILPVLNAVPGIGWAILGVIWLGVSDKSVILVLTLILLPFSMVTLREGFQASDSDLREMGRSFTRSRLSVVVRVELPQLLPYMFAGARLAFSLGWKVAIIAEFFGADAGIGLVMDQARQTFRTDLVMATIVTIGIIVFVIERWVFDPLSRWAARRSGTDLNDLRIPA